MTMGCFYVFLPIQGGEFLTISMLVFHHRRVVFYFAAGDA